VRFGPNPLGISVFCVDLHSTQITPSTVVLGADANANTITFRAHLAAFRFCFHIFSNLLVETAQICDLWSGLGIFAEWVVTIPF